jgi:hypothetical protein
MTRSVDEAPLPGADDAREAAERLHAFLVRRYWDGSALVGPDMGIRLNYRVGRFVKSALRSLPWKDDLYYNQGQAYWALGNWRLAEQTDEPAFSELALASAERLLSRQRPDGSWEYPNPEWRGRVATTEGTWGAITLLEAARHGGDERFLDGAAAWWRFLEEEMGYQQVLGGDAINYFADRRGAVVPNCSSLVLHFLGELAAAGKPEAAERCGAILTFLANAQLESGELPYTVSSPLREARMPHFQCYQYNAFQCLDLVRYYGVTGDEAALPVIRGLVRFVREGLAPDGHSRYQCERSYGHVVYHTAAMAATFAAAGLVGLEGYEEDAWRACRRLLAEQRADGSFPHSHGDYRILSDRRSYPRAHAMIHDHLLVLAGVDRLGVSAPSSDQVADVAAAAAGGA